MELSWVCNTFHVAVPCMSTQCGRDPAYNVSNSGGNAIFLSCANFFSAMYFARMISTSSRIRKLSSFISSMSFHSWKSKSISLSRFKNLSHIYYLWFLVLELILLFDSLDTAGCSIAAILQCSSSLLHPDDLVTIQSTHLECSIEISHRYRHQLIIVDIRKWTWRERSLQKGRQTLSIVDTDLLGCSLCYLIPMIRWVIILKYTKVRIQSSWTEM